MELMAIDVWLNILSKTIPIMAGRQQILSRIPTMVQEIAELNEKRWEGVSYGNRDDLDYSVAALLDKLAAFHLSGAEKLYVLAALLRTVKVGLSIALGTDSSPLMEIIETDVQVHLL